jgi:septum formation protein
MLKHNSSQHGKALDSSAISKKSSVVLASASPRRKELLSYICANFICHPADIDETPREHESATQLVERLAREKAQHVCHQYPNDIVIGSDTVVAVKGKILGKPIDYTDFTSMMTLLSDSVHQVYTGVCVLQQGQIHCTTVTTEVKMMNITAQDIESYWQSDEPQDKAGGYAIQGIGGQFVVSINGSFSAVVGLPLFETKQLLCKLQ